MHRLCNPENSGQYWVGAPQKFEEQMRSYISCSEFVDNLRNRLGMEKPKWAQFDEWDDWHRAARTAHPYGYFLTETLPNWLDTVWDFINSPYYDTRYYIRNRFIRKTHVLRTDCPVGTYQDIDERLLGAMANAVIDFVEIELAYKSNWCVTDASKTAVWREGRCPELGLDYLRLEQEMVYDENESYHNPELLGQRHPQAIEADEILAIYNWAKNRPNRPDPYDVSGWNDYCEENRKLSESSGKSYFAGFFSNNNDAEMSARRDAAHQKLTEVEKQYQQEDDDMLMRIVKIRRRLWS